MDRFLTHETTRLAEQERLDREKTPQHRNKLGQFATPPALAFEIAQHARSLLKHRKGEFRFLDPAIGTGSFFSAFLRVFPPERIGKAAGVELDSAFAAVARTIWREAGLEVLEGDFTRQPIPGPDGKFNVILTNPPYVRHHHLNGEAKQWLGDLAYSITGLRLSGLAGLYCYFLLIAHAWLADMGYAAWLIPSEFMDVNYGEEIKRYLIEKVTLQQVHRFDPADVQFDDALVSSAIVVFENKKPEPEHEVVFSLGGTLRRPARAGSYSLTELAGTPKWTSLPRAGNNTRAKKTVVLGDLFVVKRGLATGNNEFFIIPEARLQELHIPRKYVRPILPSPRYLKTEVIESSDEGWPLLDDPLALIDCPLSEEEVQDRYPRFWDYLMTGKKSGVDRGYLASRRSPWYSQEKRPVAPFLCTYMGRSLDRPFRFIRNKSQATAANVYLLLYPKGDVTRALRREPSLYEEVFSALRSIGPEEFLSEGRVYGGGLHKMEPAELMRLPGDALAKVLGIKHQRQLSLL